MVIILGTAAKGGIDGVINDHIASGLYKRTGFKRIVTHRGVTKFGDLISFISAVFIFLNTLVFYKVTAIHAHMSYNGSFWRKLFFFIIAKIFRRKFICHLHGSEFKDYVKKSSFFRLYLIRFLIKYSDGFFVLSEGWAAYVNEIFGVKVTVINNFVDVPEEYQNRNSKNREIVFIGAFIKRKGIIDLVKAYKLSGCKNILHLCGDGPLKRDVEELIFDLNLSESVILHGWVDFETKMNLLASSQIFVLPTYNEGLPLTIIEAFAAGATVITTPVGAIPEIVKHYHTGILIEPGDTLMLSNAIRFLSENLECSKQYSTNASLVYTGNFRSEIVVPKIKAAYKNISVEL